MSRYRKISVRIWNDAKFASMSDDGKLAFFFVLTHPHMTALGAMRATVEGLAAELGWPFERLSKAFREATGKRVLLIDEAARCVFLPNFIKHNPPESPNVVLAWEKALDDIPECDLKTVAIQAATAQAKGMSEGFAKACERLPKAFSKTMPYQEHEQEQEQKEQPLSPAVPDDATDGDGASHGDGDKNPKGRVHPIVPDTPHEALIDLYHATLPELPSVKAWGEKRAKALKKTWRWLLTARRRSGERFATSAQEGLDWFQRYFEHCGKSDFLMGRAGDKWQADLEWLVNYDNVVKVIEGRYHPADEVAK